MTGGARVPAVAPLAALLALSAALGSCGRADAAPGSAARDSAGVRIVESSRPAWSERDAWTVDTVPSLSIGEVSGAPELSLSGVSGVVRLADGSIAVADGTSREIRVFDGAGRFVRKLGGKGEGPGEFTAIQTLGVTGDTLWVYDLSRRRLTFFDARSGGFRTASLAGAASLPTLVGRRSDGAFVFAADVLPSDPSGLPNGFWRPEAVYFRTDAEGVVLDTLLVGKAQERIVHASADRIELIRPLFSRAASRAVIGDELAYGDQVAYEARVYGASGLGRLLRRSGVELALTDRDYTELEEQAIARAPAEAQPGLGHVYEEQERPTARPAFNRFLPGADGELWVQDWTFDGAAPVWSVFGADGAWLGEVRMPGGFRPLAIGREEVLGVWRDALDVEFVRGYRLRRAG